MRGRLAATCVLLAVLAGAGCVDPYRAPPPPSAPETAHPGDTDDVPPFAPGGDSAPAPPSRRFAAPRAAIDAFCAHWANWSWRTIVRQQRRLAAMATDGLAAALAAQARLRAADEALRRDRLASRGRVVAIDVKPGRRSRRAICVTFEEQLEHERGDPLGARHRVYVARVVRTSEGWGIARWEPQP